MEDTIDKIKKSIKGEYIFIYLMIFVMIGIFIFHFSNIIQYANRDASDFEVKIANEKGWENLYCLYVDGENYDTVDYNTYLNVDFNGNTNIKMCLIIDEVVRAVRSLMILLLLIIAYQMLRSIIREGRPFTQKNSKRLRLMSIGIVLIALVPGCLKVLLTTAYFPSSNIELSQINFFVLILGVFIGGISEIFKYGCEMQSDLDWFWSFCMEDGGTDYERKYD